MSAEQTGVGVDPRVHPVRDHEEACVRVDARCSCRRRRRRANRPNRPAPVLVADQRRRRSRRRAVHGRPDLRGAGNRCGDGRGRSDAARAVGGAVCAVRGPRRIARRGSAQRPAPLLPVPIPAAPHRGRHVRQGRRAARHEDQLPRAEQGRTEDVAAGSGSDLRDAGPVDACAVPRAVGCVGHPRHVGERHVRRHRSAGVPRQPVHGDRQRPVRPRRADGDPRARPPLPEISQARRRQQAADHRHGDSQRRRPRAVARAARPRRRRMDSRVGEPGARRAAHRRHLRRRPTCQPDAGEPPARRRQ